MPTLATEFTPEQIEAETQRLLGQLMHVECDPRGRVWNWSSCARIAPLTLEINTLKRERNAVILGHSYVDPEIVYGVADFTGDSYALARNASKSDAEMIVFAGVVFMAETAKVLCPEAQVVVPDARSGCSLADSLTGPQLRELKKRYPDAVPVCYINCNADVKAECEVVVTSTNVYDICAKLPGKEILFVPDRLMAENIRVEMRKRGIDKTVYTSDGTCIVHDHFTAAHITEARQRYPGLVVVSHPECTREIVEASDFNGSTGAMIEYVRSSKAPYYMMLTECGLVSRLEVEDPEKRFIAGCKMCPYMKLNSLEKIRDVLMEPRPEQVVTLDDRTVDGARKALKRMFELTES